MAARRLVLNGLTAEVGSGTTGTACAGAGAVDSPEELEFYHELELYRQLLALPTSVPVPAPCGRRARTPDPTPVRKGLGTYPGYGQVSVVGYIRLRYISFVHNSACVYLQMRDRAAAGRRARVVLPPLRRRASRQRPRTSPAPGRLG